jgi:hypothetical protein
VLRFVALLGRGEGAQSEGGFSDAHFGPADIFRVRLEEAWGAATSSHQKVNKKYMNTFHWRLIGRNSSWLFSSPPFSIKTIFIL